MDQIPGSRPAALLAEAKAEWQKEQARKKQKEAAEEQRLAQERAAREGPTARVNRANYDRVQEGMSLGQVKDILGPGKEVSSAGDIQIFTWQGGVLFPKVISIPFDDNAVIGKAILD